MNKIIKFSPNRVWRTYVGGKMLDSIEGKMPPQDTRFPEDWIGSIVEANNIGREDIIEGLASVLDENGDSAQQNQANQLQDIPLVKYLDSATRLHF